MNPTWLAEIPEVRLASSPGAQFLFPHAPEFAQTLRADEGESGCAIVCPGEITTYHGPFYPFAYNLCHKLRADVTSAVFGLSLEWVSV